MAELAKSAPRAGVRDMTSGSIYGHMVGFALPLLISLIFQQLYNTADSYIVGQFLGTDALAAVSSSGTLIHLMVSFFMGTSQGASVIISRFFGAGEEENVSRAIHTNVAFGLTVGVLLTIIGVAFTPTLLVWMKTDPDVLPQAIEYFRFYFMGGLALVMYNTLRGIMNAVGDSRRPLYYLIFSSVLNVILDLLFVGLFRWGVWSAAVATVLSQAASVVLCAVYLMRKGNIFTVELRKIRFHMDMLRQILRYGIPSGLQNSVISIANVLVQTQINSFGKFATAAFGVHAKIEAFAFLPINSFSMAITTFISQNLGAREYDRAKKGARFGILCAVLMAESIGVIVYLFSPTLIALFDDSAQVIALGVQQSRVAALFYCLLAFSHAVAAVCRGAGRAIIPMFIMMSVWCVLRICYIFAVMHFVGDIGLIYWAYPITWSISSVIYLIYYLRSDWVHGFDRP